MTRAKKKARNTVRKPEAPILYIAVTDDRGLDGFFHRYDKGPKVEINVLISYAYLQGQASGLLKLKNQRKIKRLVLDSGAFSASTGKSTIDVYEYALWLSRFGHYFDLVFSLDDSFDDLEHNRRNYEFIKSRIPKKDITLVPVCHATDKSGSQAVLEEVEAYVNDGCKYIAIGSKPRLTNETLLELQAKYPNVRFHMFGRTDKNMLTEVLPYSADSATYAHRAGIGTILFRDESGESHTIYNGGRQDMPDRHVHWEDFDHKDEFQTQYKTWFGRELKYPELIRQSTSHHLRQHINIMYFLDMQKRLRQLKQAKDGM